VAIKKTKLIILCVFILVMIILSMLLIKHIVKPNKDIYQPNPWFDCEEKAYCKDMKMIICRSEAGENFRFAYINESLINACGERKVGRYCLPSEWDCNNTEIEQDIQIYEYNKNNRNNSAKE
jgi:hypothetical protein